MRFKPVDQSLRYVGISLIIFAMLAFALYVWAYGFYAYRLFLFPFDYDQGEGYELLDTVLFSQGQWPYRNSDVYPFYSSNYPPVYHLVTVPLVWIFGPQYWTGRLVSFISTLISAYLIGYGVARFRAWKSGRGWIYVLSGAIFLSSNYVYHIGPLFRQHIFMVMFEIGAIVLFANTIALEEETGKQRPWRLLAVMLLLLLAGFTKQLAYASVASIFIFWFLRDIRRSIIWAIPFALSTGAVFLFINLATDNQWFINTISANLNEFIFGQMVGLFTQWFKLHRMITLAAVGVTLYQLYFERLSLYAVWFTIATANSVTAGTWGAGESYFTTAIAASCILTGIGFMQILDWSKETDMHQAWPISAQTISLISIGALLLWQANTVFHLPTHTPFLQSIASLAGRPTETMVAPQTSCSEPRPPEPIPFVDDAFTLVGRPPTDADRDAGIAITTHILEGETPAFSEEAGFNFYAGREIVTNPTQLRNLSLAGLLDTSEMVSMLEDQAFDTVVFRAQFYPGEVLTVIGQQYETVDLIQMNGFVYCVLKPKVKES
ncbi:MAG: hypothetical protein AAF633_05765 [Chloroflexota bacterium]